MSASLEESVHRFLAGINPFFALIYLWLGATLFMEIRELCIMLEVCEAIP